MQAEQGRPDLGDPTFCEHANHQVLQKPQKITV